MFQIIFKLGALITNRGLFKSIDELKKSDLFPYEKLMEIKKTKLNMLIKVAVNKSLRFNKFKNIDIRIDNLKIIEKSSKFDLLTHKDEFITNYDKRVQWVETSGTSGQTLYFPKGRFWDTNNRASWMRSYLWYGVNPWDRNGYLWGFKNKGFTKYKTAFLDFLQNRFRLFTYDRESSVKFLSKLQKAVFLHGYSSMIYELAKIALELGYTPKDFPRLKMIKGTSEKIYDFYQPVVLKVFGKKIISEYGAAETGIIAFECPEGNMHINEENVIVEVDKNGEIVVTNLNSFSFPIIRYQLGDKVKIDNFQRCVCGRKSKIIKEVEGRIGKNILGYQKKYPSLTLYYIFKNLALRVDFQCQYQGYQNDQGILQLRIFKSLSESERIMILKECKDYFNDDLEIEIVADYTIPLRDKKLRDFITELE